MAQYEIQIGLIYGDRLFGSATGVGRCVVPQRAIVGWSSTALEHSENNFLAKAETRATIAMLSADRSLVEVAGLRDEATGPGENCRAWRWTH